MRSGDGVRRLGLTTGRDSPYMRYSTLGCAWRGAGSRCCFLQRFGGWDGLGSSGYSDLLDLPIPNSLLKEQGFFTVSVPPPGTTEWISICAAVPQEWEAHTTEGWVGLIFDEDGWSRRGSCRSFEFGFDPDIKAGIGGWSNSKRPMFVFLRFECS